MPLIATSALPRPDSWEEFEKMCRDIFARRWQDPGARLNGRKGQLQRGVDIYGRPAGLSARYAGVQVKLRAELGLTRELIEAEIAKAETFDTGVLGDTLAEYTIATTEPRNSRLQQIVRQICAERKKSGRFPVDVMFWEDISQMLLERANRDLLVTYYPDWSTLFIEAHKTSTNHDSLADAPTQEEQEALLKALNLAASFDRLADGFTLEKVSRFDVEARRMKLLQLRGQLQHPRFTDFRRAIDRFSDATWHAFNIPPQSTNPLQRRASDRAFEQLDKEYNDLVAAGRGVPGMQVVSFIELFSLSSDQDLFSGPASHLA